MMSSTNRGLSCSPSKKSSVGSWRYGFSCLNVLPKPPGFCYPSILLSLAVPFISYPCHLMEIASHQYPNKEDSVLSSQKGSSSSNPLSWMSLVRNGQSISCAESKAITSKSNEISVTNIDQLWFILMNCGWGLFLPRLLFN